MDWVKCFTSIQGVNSMDINFYNVLPKDFWPKVVKLIRKASRYKRETYGA